VLNVSGKNQKVRVDLKIDAWKELRRLKAQFCKPYSEVILDLVRAYETLESLKTKGEEDNITKALVNFAIEHRIPIWVELEGEDYVILHWELFRDCPPFYNNLENPNVVFKLRELNASE